MTESRIDFSIPTPAEHPDCKALGALHFRAHSISFKGFANRNWIEARTLSAYEAYWCKYLDQQHPAEQTWKVEDRDRIVGTVSVIPFMHSSVAFRPKKFQDVPDTQIACLRLMYVDPGVQERGLGQILIKSALHYMQANGYKAATLITHAANRKARRFYERAGWILDDIFTAKVSEFFPEPEEMKIRARYIMPIQQ